MSTNSVLFEGNDTTGNVGLWITDGTAAGTHELAVISDAGPGGGFFPSGFLGALNGQVLFNGVNSNGIYGLWLSDGTAAGTHELTGISGANGGGILGGGGATDSFTVFNGQMLFAGENSNGQFGLWASDGRAVGTQELTGILGANFQYGVAPNDLTVFNGNVLFQGLDTNGQEGLWVTDGTALGTHELNISGTSWRGVWPSKITVFSGGALFAGLDASFNFGLWATDGTAAGTHELTGISDANAAGVFHASSQPGGLTVFKGEVLFDGTDVAGNVGLWVSDGTAAGTHELTGISGAAASGISPTNMVVFNDTVLFNGQDASGNYGLWVTDGTAAGTREIVGINGVNSGGLNPLDITVFNGDVLFDGTDAAGNLGLWVSDGTAAGTHEISGINGAPASGLFPRDLTPFAIPMINQPPHIVLPFGKQYGAIKVTQDFGEGAREPTDLNDGTPNDHGNTKSKTDIDLYYSVDFALVVGTPVLAQGKGHVVDFSFNVPDALTQIDPITGKVTVLITLQTEGLHNFGNYITIQYDDGYVATYMHLQQNSIPDILRHINADVTLGDPIAKVGLTGATGGPHLHVTYGEITDDLYTDVLVANGSKAANPKGPPVNFNVGPLLDDHYYISDNVPHTVSDGYLAGATVFGDANGNGKLDPGEVSTVADAFGVFTLPAGTGPLVASGGTDISTGLRFSGVLSTPAGSSQITPLTSLIVALQSFGVSNADAMIHSAFGIDVSFDLANTDPIAAAQVNDSAGSKEYAVGAEVINTVTMIASALTSNGNSTAQNTIEVFGALASSISTHGAGSVNLADVSFVSQLVTASADVLHLQIDSSFITALAGVVSASNSALEQNSFDLTDQALIEVVSSIERLAQGAVSDALQKLAADSSLLDPVLNAFTGSNLANALAPQSKDANHAPWLATDAVTSHSLSELTGKTGSNTFDATNGKLLFTDADLSGTHQVGAVLEQSSIKWMNADGTLSSTALAKNTSDALIHAVQATLVSDSTHGSIGELSWSFSAADHYFDFLAAGESLYMTYDVAVTDNQGATSVEPITIVINGSDDNPTALPDSNGVAKGSTISVTASAGVLSNDSDPDIHDHLVVGAVNGLTANVGHEVKGTYGSLTLNADGSYAYTANKGALPAQIVAQDTFNYTVSDGHGGTSTVPLNIVVSNPDVTYRSGVNTTLVGSNGKNVLDGSAGHDVLMGGNGADVLIGGNGDTLTGGSGPDTFLFRPDFGTNVITDFNINNDVLQLDKSLFASLTDVFDHTIASNSGAIINDGHGDTITLIGVALPQLPTHQSDFHLV